MKKDLYHSPESHSTTSLIHSMNRHINCITSLKSHRTPLLLSNTYKGQYDDEECALDFCSTFIVVMLLRSKEHKKLCVFPKSFINQL